MLNGKLLSNAFPINKVEVFFDDLDHSTFLGFTWERVGSGKVPVGLDTSDNDFNTIGKTGGSKTNTLSLENYAYKVYNTDPEYVNNDIQGNWNPFETLLNLGIGSNFVTNNNTPVNNLQPYIVMAFWKRIA